MTSMLSFVLENLPSDWEPVSSYNSSYLLFDVRDSRESERVKAMFNSTSLNINRIQRVQNPFQYGRFKLRQEMLNSYSVETAFHAVPVRDLETALKYTCDYRRYEHGYKNEGESKQPLFHPNAGAAVPGRFAPNDILLCVLVVNKISGTTNTQSDYYIQYVVDFQ